jgi:hypothetical protein
MEDSQYGGGGSSSSSSSSSSSGNSSSGKKRGSGVTFAAGSDGKGAKGKAPAKKRKVRLT